jgi:hypothetical protein
MGIHRRRERTLSLAAQKSTPPPPPTPPPPVPFPCVMLRRAIVPLVIIIVFTVWVVKRDGEMVVECPECEECAGVAEVEVHASAAAPTLGASVFAEVEPTMLVRPAPTSECEAFICSVPTIPCVEGDDSESAACPGGPLLYPPAFLQYARDGGTEEQDHSESVTRLFRYVLR